MHALTAVNYDRSGINQYGPSDNSGAEVNIYSDGSKPDLNNDLAFFHNDP